MTKVISPFELDEAFFQRSQFYGWDFTWYAVDSIGSIAQFTSGYNAIPESIFSSKINYEKVDGFFEDLPLITQSLLSPAYQTKKNLSLNSFAIALKEAKRGIFIFEESVEMEIQYQLCAIPKIELKLKDLPKEIQEYLNLYTVKSINFCETEKLNITDYFECDITAQKCD